MKDEAYKILLFFFSFLAPSNEELPIKLQKIDPEDPSETKLVETETRYPLPETEGLWHMGQSKEHRHLLKHPVITSFLWLKWQRIRRYFNRNLRFYMLFVFILTWYIFENFGGNTMKPKSGSIPLFHGLFALFEILVVIFIFKDWKNDLKDIIRMNQTIQNEDNLDQGVDCKQIFWLIIKNWCDMALIVCLTLILITGAKSLFITLLGMFLTIQNFYHFRHSLKMD